jgi:hypothetical protein
MIQQRQQVKSTYGTYPYTCITKLLIIVASPAPGRNVRGRLLQIDYILEKKMSTASSCMHACMDDFCTCFYISQVAGNTQACIALYILILFFIQAASIESNSNCFFLTYTLFLLDFRDWLNAWGKVNSRGASVAPCWSVGYLGDVMNDNARLFP